MKTTTFLEYIDFCNIIKETTEKDLSEWKNIVENYYDYEIDDFYILEDNEDYAIGSIIDKTDLNSSILFFNDNNKWKPIGGYVDKILYIDEKFKKKNLSVPLIINTSKIRGGTFIEPKYFTKEGLFSHMSAHRDLVLENNRNPKMNIILSNPKLISFFLKDYQFFINNDESFIYGISNKYFLKEKVFFINKIDKENFHIIESDIHISLEEIYEKYKISHKDFQNIQKISLDLCSENFMHM